MIKDPKEYNISYSELVAYIVKGDERVISWKFRRKHLEYMFNNNKMKLILAAAQTAILQIKATPQGY